MNVTKLWVNVDRQEALRRGINGTDSPVQIDVDVASLSVEDRGELALRK